MTSWQWEDARVKRLSVHLLWALLLLGTVNIALSAYANLNGPFVWRQADVYAQILGFMGQRGLSGFEDFFGRPAFYDVPIYQYLIAWLARISGADPLAVTRVVNVLLWIALIPAAYGIADRLQDGAGKYVAALLTAAPLFVHYFSTPLPDNLALAASLLAVCLQMARPNRALLAGSIALIGLGSLIKSPVAFVPVTFYGAHLLMNDARRLRSPFVVAFFAVSAACAVLAELARSWFFGVSVYGFAEDPLWYFGTLDLRTSAHFYRTIWDRTFTDSFPRRFIGVAAGAGALGLLALAMLKAPATFRHVATCAVAFAAGWLVFANVYYVHDYYQLPVTLFFLMAFAVLAGWAERSLPFMPNWLPLLLIVALTPLALVKASPKRDLAVTSVYDAMAFMLMPVDRLLYVLDPALGEKIENPSPELAGRLRIRVDVIEKAAFERDCGGRAGPYRAVLVRGESACAPRLADLYTDRLVSPPFRLFYRRGDGG